MKCTTKQHNHGFDGMMLILYWMSVQFLSYHFADGLSLGIQKRHISQVFILFARPPITGIVMKFVFCIFHSSNTLTHCPLEDLAEIVKV